MAPSVGPAKVERTVKMDLAGANFGPLTPDCPACRPFALPPKFWASYAPVPSGGGQNISAIVSLEPITTT